MESKTERLWAREREREREILTGKVAGEQEHQGKDNQERDVRLQDPCDGQTERQRERGGREMMGEEQISRVTRGGGGGVEE